MPANRSHRSEDLGARCINAFYDAIKAGATLEVLKEALMPLRSRFQHPTNPTEHKRLQKAFFYIMRRGFSYAVIENHCDIVQFFLSEKLAKVDGPILERIDYADTNGHAFVSKAAATPLRFAVANGFEEMVNILVNAKANVDGHNCRGETALILAVRARHPAMIHCLLSAGADVNSVAHNGETALSIAVSQEDESLVRCLLQLGAQPNILKSLSSRWDICLYLISHALPVSEQSMNTLVFFSRLLCHPKEVAAEHASYFSKMGSQFFSTEQQPVENLPPCLCAISDFVKAGNASEQESALLTELIEVLSDDFSQKRLDQWLHVVNQREDVAEGISANPKVESLVIDCYKALGEAGLSSTPLVSS